MNKNLDVEVSKWRRRGHKLITESMLELSVRQFCMVAEGQDARQRACRSSAARIGGRLGVSGHLRRTRFEEHGLPETVLCSSASFRKQGRVHSWNRGRLPKSGQIRSTPTEAGRVRAELGRHGAHDGRTRLESGQTRPDWGQHRHTSANLPRDRPHLGRFRPILMRRKIGIRFVSMQVAVVTVVTNFPHYLLRRSFSSTDDRLRPLGVCSTSWGKLEAASLLDFDFWHPDSSISTPLERSRPPPMRPHR